MAVKKKEQELDQLRLEVEAKLSDVKQKKLFEEFNKKQDELKEQLKIAKRDLEFLRRRFEHAHTRTSQITALLNSQREAQVMKHIRDRLVHELGGREFILEAPSNVIKKRFSLIKEDLHPRFIEDMEQIGLVDSGINLTDQAVLLLKKIAKEF